MNNRNENDEQNFQYVLYQFASHFSSIEFEFNSIQFSSVSMQVNSIRFNLNAIEINRIWIQFQMDFLNSIQCFEFNLVELGTQLNLD